MTSPVRSFAEGTTVTVDVAVVGGGAGGVSAALQAARLGRQVALVEEMPWLGGV